jgi:hypothetical protein
VLLKRENKEELLDTFVLNASNLLVQKEDQTNYQKSFSQNIFLDDKY